MQTHFPSLSKTESILTKSSYVSTTLSMHFRALFERPLSREISAFRGPSKSRTAASDFRFRPPRPYCLPASGFSNIRGCSCHRVSRENFARSHFKQRLAFAQKSFARFWDFKRSGVSKWLLPFQLFVSERHNNHVRKKLQCSREKINDGTLCLRLKNLAHSRVGTV